MGMQIDEGVRAGGAEYRTQRVERGVRRFGEGHVAHAHHRERLFTRTRVAERGGGG